MGLWSWVGSVVSWDRRVRSDNDVSRKKGWNEGALYGVWECLSWGDMVGSGSFVSWVARSGQGALYIRVTE